MNCSEVLGKLIKEKRTELGYSIRKLSDAVGISGTELTRIESGERVTPNLLTLIYICKVLRLDMNNLLTVSGFNSDGKNKLYKMKVTKSTEKIYNISASNDDEAFDNMAKYLEDKGVFDFSEKCELLYEIIDENKNNSLEDNKKIDEDGEEFDEEFEDGFYESEDCKTCKHYCPLCEECIYGED